MYWLVCFISRLREANFENSSLVASLAATPVLSPGIARAPVWVRLGAVARSRGIGRRGARGQPVLKTRINYKYVRVKIRNVITTCY